ncbi:MAG: type II secretion system F family protein [Candidatus Omnitrophota bacterium]
MPKFKYSVKDPDGKSLSGIVEAGNTGEVVDGLRKKGFLILSVKEEAAGGFFGMKGGSFFAKKVKMDDLVIFARQLATMVDAGIPLVSGLDILGQQEEKPVFRSVLLSVRDSVETGSSLSEAMAKHKNVFSELFINMVRAGESSGMLDDILDRLAMYLEKSSALQKKAQSAMTYPAIVSAMALAITLALLIFVIPIFKEIYSGFGAKLPAPTQVLLSISEFLTNYFFFAVALAVIAVISFKKYAATEKGRARLDGLILNLPIFGILFKKIAVSKFTRTLSTLIKSGVSILASLDIVGKTAGNKAIENALAEVRNHVRDGEGLAEPLSRCKIFPSMVVRMIAVGEQSGELEKMLSKIADFYESQVDTAVSGLTSMIEPLVIAVLGIVVGTIVICMFLPVFQISSIVGA